ncbi:MULTISPECIES: SpaA isopeptide-forming pilin-related protein [Streptomyces]|uniref:SpaA isopeptide-forming pilin-related protein n=1 Tax=Streptomyces TaxID=1883 RepID=UPI002255DFEA|nr:MULTISPECIES: SpaA isopeptide-forming pilin-related protein [Streptomyces]MCX5278390.1 SpaA isopeptide-forming pilin-related protein [Streptomyces virginiae]MCX5583018.1 SpaA isopeptide-forming pilin-related protein [Streptomyces erythrochromogenes]
MHSSATDRFPTVVAATVAALVAGTLLSASTAWAEAPEPQPGTVEITKKDPDGALLAGAEFNLLDTLNGTKALSGTTDADGVLRFEGVTPGVWRLKETATGSPIHELAPDQDVIVTPGQTVKLAVVDPFKPSDLTVTKTDKASGKPLAGAVINITPASGDGKPVTLTTGKDGTATAKLPVTARAGTIYTATETEAPDGYQLNSTPVKITAKPGAPVTATFTNTKKEQPTQPPTTPAPTPTTPTTPPVTPSTKPTPSTPATSQPPTSFAAPTPEETTSSTSSPAPTGSLARTGADATGWLLAGAGLLVAAGGGALLAVRRRRDAVEDDQTTG